MKPTSPAILRPVKVLGPSSRIAIPHFVPRRFATHHQTSSTPESRRRSVTPFDDDGHVPWTNLSAGEKTGRAVQQTFNFGMVIVGLVMTGGVGYFLYQEVFSTDSKVAYFNRAVDRIKKDPRCLEMLGDSKKITAFGEETSNKWRRARPIA
jgi:import inner membrane translocase subunit TIM21